MDMRASRYLKLNEPEILDQTKGERMTFEVNGAMVKLREAIYEAEKLLQISKPIELQLVVNHLNEAADALKAALSKP
jgi:hypothetical protein